MVLQYAVEHLRVVFKDNPDAIFSVSVQGRQCCSLHDVINRNFDADFHFHDQSGVTARLRFGSTQRGASALAANPGFKDELFFQVRRTRMPLPATYNPHATIRSTLPELPAQAVAIAVHEVIDVVKGDTNHSLMVSPTTTGTTGVQLMHTNTFTMEQLRSAAMWQTAPKDTYMFDISLPTDLVKT